MPTISSLKLGAAALMAQRAAIETTGHNIANISTPGYSRQRAEINSRSPQPMPFGFLGRGADVIAVRSISDRYLEAQLRGAASEFAGDEVIAEAYRNMEAFFNELTEFDLSTGLSGFFSALQDLAANVENEAARSAVVQQGQTLADLAHDLSADFVDLRSRMDDQIVGLVSNVNELAAQAADLNAEIVRAEAGRAEGSAADLRDRRTQVLKDLAQLVDVRVIEISGGSVSVSVAGTPLVFLGEHFELRADLETSRGQAAHVVRLADGGSPLKPGSGQLQGLIGARDEVLVSFMDDLDEMVSTLVWNFNRLHAEGVGKKALSSVRSTYAVANPSAALSQANLSFDAPTGTFTIQNGSFTIHVRDEVTGTVSARNVSIDLDGIGTDTALLNTVTGNDLVSLINAAAPELTATVDNQGILEIRSNSNQTTFYFSNDTSGVLATLGLNAFFVGYNGLNMEVNPVIVADDSLVAAGLSVAAGDNLNIIEMAGIRELELFASGSKTVEDFYQSVVSRLGTESSRALSSARTRESLLSRLENEREQLSGVSLDEELAKLIQFQRTYQGAARFVSVVDDLIATLLEI